MNEEDEKIQVWKDEIAMHGGTISDQVKVKDLKKLNKDLKTSWDMVQNAVGSLPRTKVVSADNNKIHAECRSMTFLFVDDLMLHLTPSNGIIHIRSASRTGYFDLGINRDRVESLRRKLQQKGILE